MDYSDLSLGKSKVLYGVEVKKLPLGDYLKAVKKIFSFRSDVLDKCFPDKTLSEIIEDLSSKKGEELRVIMENVTDVVSTAFVGCVAELVGIDFERLINDDNIGIYGFSEIVITFAELNDLKKCFALWGKMFKIKV